MHFAEKQLAKDKAGVQPKFCSYKLRMYKASVKYALANNEAINYNL